ncbi:MAG TPA: hypothetical protein PKY28_07540, partial [Ferruginibacter sp.]|nr:hypothetical protein [Ferruginibacter sp.]
NLLIRSQMLYSVELRSHFRLAKIGVYCIPSKQEFLWTHLPALTEALLHLSHETSILGHRQKP